MKKSNMYVPLLLGLVLAGCFGDDFVPLTFGETVTLVRDERLELKDETGRAFPVTIPQRALVEVHVFERASGTAQACIIPPSEVKFWNEGRQTETLKCTGETRDRSGASILLGPGDYAVGVRCTSSFRNCDVTYTLSYRVVEESSP